MGTWNSGGQLKRDVHLKGSFDRSVTADVKQHAVEGMVGRPRGVVPGGKGYVWVFFFALFSVIAPFFTPRSDQSIPVGSCS